MAITAPRPSDLSRYERRAPTTGTDSASRGLMRATGTAVSASSKRPRPCRSGRSTRDRSAPPRTDSRPAARGLDSAVHPSWRERSDDLRGELALNRIAVDNRTSARGAPCRQHDVNRHWMPSGARIEAHARGASPWSGARSAPTAAPESTAELRAASSRLRAGTGRRTAEKPPEPARPDARIDRSGQNTAEGAFISNSLPWSRRRRSAPTMVTRDIESGPSVARFDRPPL